ncbi:MAG: hypothetical protein ACRENG_19145 [bacterium]
MDAIALFVCKSSGFQVGYGASAGCPESMLVITGSGTPLAPIYFGV